MSLKYFLKTYGCQMNVADSAKLAGVLEAAGYEPIQRFNNSTIQQLDLILVNTCVVRQNAEDRAAWFVTSLKNLKTQNSKLKIILCGCMVTEPGRDLKKQFPHVDFFISPNGSAKLAEYLHWTLDTLPAGRQVGHWTLSKHSTIKPQYVSIMHGCNNFCSYCVVPYVRGREVSRSMDEVLEEIRILGEQGIRNITLLGQNVNAYKYGLANLLREIGEVVFGNSPPLFSREGETPTKVGEGVSFLTSHPRDMSDKIIEAVAQLPYVAKDFVMPLQSGDDEILKKMNRGYNLEHYINRVNKIRALIPHARISTDIIVGFPGETEEQFQNTLRAIERIKFNDVHMFAYSTRPMTAAAKLPGQLPEEVKQERLNKLIALNRRTIGAAFGLQKAGE